MTLQDNVKTVYPPQTKFASGITKQEVSEDLFIAPLQLFSCCKKAEF